MLATFAKWDDMILGELLRTCSAISTAPLVILLHRCPLRVCKQWLFRFEDREPAHPVGAVAGHNSLALLFREFRFRTSFVCNSEPCRVCSQD